MIICIEGGDACGKLTQSTLLAERLKGTRFAFPNYDTPTGKAILGHLKREWCAGSLDFTESFDKPFIRPDSCDPLVFQSLMTVNRFEVLPEITAALARGPVVFDRFTASGLVYGGLDGVDREWIALINSSLPVPNVNILLDAPVAEGFARRPERRDRYESDREFMEKVRDEYLKLWGVEVHTESRASFVVDHVSRTDRPGWYVINAVGTVEEVHERIINCVRLWMPSAGK